MIKSRQEELTKKFYEISEQLYKAAQPEAGAQALERRMVSKPGRMQTATMRQTTRMFRTTTARNKKGKADVSIFCNLRRNSA